MKSFGSWDTQDLHFAFGLQDVDTLPILNDWISNSCEIPENIANELEDLRKAIFSLNEDWNEDELKMNFIAPLLRLIHYGKKDTYNAFFQRSLSATINDIEIGGIVDMEIAKGWKKPIKPYFFLHEYKQDQGGKSDARAQLLAAMLAAQTLNADEKPVFGVYLVAASWRFMVLEGKEYAVYRLDATKREDIHAIFCMLQWVKNWIHQELQIG
ncbi:MAG: hypothetical protein ACKVTZ_07495 [Bacteroidia bacterium]